MYVYFSICVCSQAREHTPRWRRAVENLLSPSPFSWVQGSSSATGAGEQASPSETSSQPSSAEQRETWHAGSRCCGTQGRGAVRWWSPPGVPPRQAGQLALGPGVRCAEQEAAGWVRREASELGGLNSAVECSIEFTPTPGWPQVLGHSQAHTCADT